MKPFFIILFIAILLPFSVSATSLEHQTVIDRFYLEREGKSLWIKGRKLNRYGKELRNVLEESWINGLDPRRYHVEQMNKIFETHEARGRIDKDYLIQLELLLTDGYIRYIQDLSGMRIHARDMGLNPKHWRQRISAQEALSFLPENKKKIKKFLSSREPQGKTYKRLKEELKTLVKKQNSSKEQPKRLIFKTAARPGRGYNDIPKLRARLKSKPVPQESHYTYDPDLVQAVMQFQKQNGLKPDGIIGKKTLHILNQGTKDKIKQIVLNMERLRWVADEKPERFIVVNIPSAMLWGIDQGKVAFEMPVIVGRKKRPTESFITNIHGVRFNPTWTVPSTIKKEDILPQLQEDPLYFSDKGIELYDGYGKDAPTLDPVAIDWGNMTEEELKELRMVQISGGHNPLGRIRILMPNAHNIYLHDTNNKALFARANRAKSSGCVRMSNPEKVALFALKNRKGWDKNRMHNTLETGEMHDVYISERIPVYLLYYTAWLGDKDKIIYGSDIYGHDRVLAHLLEKLDGFQIVRNNGADVNKSVY